MTNKEALELALITLERDNLKAGNIYINYDIQKALIKLVKKKLEKKQKESELLAEVLQKKVMDGMPDMPIKVQDEREDPKSFAKFAQSFGGQDGYDSAKAEWVELTAKDIAVLWKATPHVVGVYTYTDIARDVEAKLKEKNCG